MTYDPHITKLEEAVAFNERTIDQLSAELAKALTDPGAWVVHRSSRGLPGIVLTSAADRQLGRGELVDPYGSLSVRQRRVPLGLGLDRFDRIPLPVRETWDVVNGRLGTSPAPSQGELREPFAARFSPTKIGPVSSVA